jgi:hypothetical protein
MPNDVLHVDALFLLRRCEEGEGLLPAPAHDVAPMSDDEVDFLSNLVNVDEELDQAAAEEDRDFSAFCASWDDESIERLGGLR